MKIEKFWNQAFLAALTRLPVEDAKLEADRATDICIEHWQSNRYSWAPQNLMRWQDQSVGYVPAAGHRFDLKGRPAGSAADAG